MDKVQLSFASGLYDRMVSLALGQVKCPGISLNFIEVAHPREIFDRMGGNHEFDASELSSSEYITRYAAGDKSFVAIPAFPSRAFRHSCIYINTNSVQQPCDLNGKRIGVPLYTMTAAVWIRGLLQHEYDVDLESLQWVEGDVERPGTYGQPASLRPVKEHNIVQNTGSKSLNQMLEDGEIDAILSPDKPSCMSKATHVQRLFPNYKQVEMDYFRRTGIFPIMHLVVLRREYYEEHRFTAASLYSALCESKAQAQKGLLYTGTLRYMLPWLLADLEEVDEVFGGDCWPYGIEGNRKTLETLIKYLYEQGMIKQIVKVDELFAPAKGPMFDS